jgi:regulator of nonsense transcripts 2
MQEARLEEYKKIIDQKTSLRRSNLNPERPGSYFFHYFYFI